MEVDHIIAEMLFLARMLDFACLIGVPGSAAISATALELRAMAADRAKVERIFADVSNGIAIVRRVVEWMRGAGHHAAADYLTTSGHVA